jgi:hypothetical protein
MCLSWCCGYVGVSGATIIGAGLLLKAQYLAEVVEIRYIESLDTTRRVDATGDLADCIDAATIRLRCTALAACGTHLQDPTPQNAVSQVSIVLLNSARDKFLLPRASTSLNWVGARQLNPGLEEEARFSMAVPQELCMVSYCDYFAGED